MTASPKNLRVAAAPAIFGVHISRLSRAELVELMRGLPSAGRGAQLLATMNLDHVVRLQNDPAFRAAYEHAWHVTIDGTPVWLYSRLRGLRVERCTGADLIAELVPALRPESHRPFFVVSTEETGALLTQLLVRQGFKQSAIGHASPAFGFEDDAELSEQLCATIRKHKATHLVFGLGAPKSEIWIDR
jgi:N-acetylglucosaminyldiphosphoundecaprenol N-acetyl-beta-D-mannosaminyltransferase